MTSIEATKQYNDDAQHRAKPANYPAITVRDVHKSFQSQQVLSGVSFDINEAEVLVILGPSGSGKTTLLRIIAGLQQPDGGDVYLRGKRVTNLLSQERNLGVVFQEQALFQKMTVEENIAFGLKVRRASSAQITDITRRMLELVRLQDHARKYPSQLSGGQRQRVAVARALAYKPNALLFDEPFSAVDAVTRNELRREVRSLLRTMNVPAMFITHDQEEALEMADRIAVLHEGSIQQIGTPFEIYNNPINESVATFLGAANVLLGRWRDDKVVIGTLQMNAPPDAPALEHRQAVKVVFRPEDVVLNFLPQLLDTPFYLGRAIVEEVSYIGPIERLVLRLMIWPAQVAQSNRRPRFLIVDEDGSDGFPIKITRTKWEATQMELASGDSVAVGLKDYRLLPHYPLHSESGAKFLG